ncbi:VOC family protein [Halorubrum rutilum]|uniref:VOC family protein n=1 Tax=Halorubrum rutilum TaxID=1364933 RepID=A0ABD6ANE1_9EURY|nr:VOC family protein [Halorubrum rutilum]
MPDDPRVDRPDADRSASDRLPADTRIGRVALRVADLDETTAFYRDVVGLAVLDRDGDAAVLGVDGAEAAGREAVPLLALRRDPDRPERGPTEAGLFHVAFRVPSRAALGGALGRVRERWRLDGASDHLVSEALYLDDPEGNGVEIYRDRPREEWPVDDDGTPRMATEPLDVEGVAAAAGAADAGDAPADPSPVDRVPSGTDVGHVHLEATSLSAFEAVYVDGIGFEVGEAGPDVRFVAAGGYHHHLAANAWRGRTTPAAGRGLAWFEVVVPDAAALDAVRTRLEAVAAGGDVDVAVAEREGGVAVTDADGIEVWIRTE